MLRSLVVLAVLSAISFSSAIAQMGSITDVPPALEGYVTRAVSLSDIDVNGIRIQCGQKTLFRTATRSDKQMIVGAHSEAWVGEPVSVFGKTDNRHHRIVATEILFHTPDVHPLSGIAVIDRVLANKNPMRSSSERTVIAFKSMLPPGLFSSRH